MIDLKEVTAFALFLVEMPPGVAKRTGVSDKAMDNTLRACLSYLHVRACGCDEPAPEWLMESMAAVKAGYTLGGVMEQSRK